MRIGIVTQPLTGNFGGIFQNIALQKIITKLGHQPITIDYFHSIKFSVYCKIILKDILFSRGNKKNVFPSRIKYRKSGLADDFVSHNIVTTRKVHSYRESLITEYKLDAVITGSDQVWRPSYNNCLPDMYLRFARNSSIRRIAYAASFGVDDKEYSPELIASCLPYAQKLDAISVREQSGIDLCHDYFGINACKVLDPTLLLSSEDYKPFINKIANSPKCLGTYILDGTDEKNKIIEHVKKKLNISQCTQVIDNDSVHSPEDWISMFSNSDFIITDSFHGTVFSIIFHKPFITVGNIERGSDRFSSLLGCVKLEDRIIESNQFDLIETIVDKRIEWEQVDKRLEIERKKSIKFLRDVLSK